MPGGGKEEKVSGMKIIVSPYLSKNGCGNGRTRLNIKRLSEINLQQALASGKVRLVLGARQVGKTTLVEHVLRGQDARFLNFDVDIDKSRFLAAASLPKRSGPSVIRKWISS